MEKSKGQCQLNLTKRSALSGRERKEERGIFFWYCPEILVTFGVGGDLVVGGKDLLPKSG
jgi:hypothetical protein